MKKIISLCLLMAYGCLSVMATQDAKEYKTYVKDNHRVYYCTSQGISIVVDPSPRGLFEPHITIINDSGHDFVFEPKEIRAVKPVKSSYLILDIPVDGETYRFVIND